MTPDELEALFASIELKNSPFPIRLEFIRKGSAFKVRYEMDVRERNTGQALTSTGEMAMGHGMTRDEAIAKVFAFVEKDCFRHEAVETFHVGGVRVFDPHV